MKASLIKIGNSKGIRIPKSIIEQCKLKDEVELSVKGNRLVIQSPRKAREGWAESIDKAKTGEDELLLDLGPSEWDLTEWTW